MRHPDQWEWYVQATGRPGGLVAVEWKAPSPLAKLTANEARNLADALYEAANVSEGRAT